MPINIKQMSKDEIKIKISNIARKVETSKEIQTILAHWYENHSKSNSSKIDNTLKQVTSYKLPDF